MNPSGDRVPLDLRDRDALGIAVGGGLGYVWYGLVAGLTNSVPVGAVTAVMVAVGTALLFHVQPASEGPFWTGSETTSTGGRGVGLSMSAFAVLTFAVFQSRILSFSTSVGTDVLLFIGLFAGFVYGLGVGGLWGRGIDADDGERSADGESGADDRSDGATEGTHA